MKTGTDKVIHIIFQSGITEEKIKSRLANEGIIRQVNPVLWDRQNPPKPEYSTQ